MVFPGVMHRFLIAMGSRNKTVLQNSLWDVQALVVWHWGSAVALSVPQSTGSVVAAHEFSYPEACGILPNQGSNQRPQHWKMVFKPLDHKGSPMMFP